MTATQTSPQIGIQTDKVQAELVTAVTISLPEWFASFYDTHIKGGGPWKTPEEQMELVANLLEWQIRHQTGGPFAAAVFDKNGKPVSVGVNRVVPENDSSAHAEIVAIRLGQAAIGSFTFHESDEVKSSPQGRGPYRLVTSAQPCHQCDGAFGWTGIEELVIGVSASVTEQLTGFDEGNIPENWKQYKIERGITVTEGVLSDRIAQLMRQYSGVIYNSDAQPKGLYDPLDLTGVSGPGLQ